MFTCYHIHIHVLENIYRSVNIGMINGGENVNVVPHVTNFQIDRRITIKENINNSFKEIKNFIKKLDKSAKITFLTGTNAFKSNKKTNSANYKKDTHEQ